VRPGESSREFYQAFAILAGLTALPIWSVGYLPLVDLPQHEAQISILRHWNDPACGYPGIYEINWLTPYWLSYAFAVALAWAVGVVAAVKVALTLVLVAIPLAARRLVRELGGDEWWALLCFPLGFGFPLSWGFFSFLAAVPFVLWALGDAFRYARAPTAPGGLRLGLMCAALFAVHALAMAFAVLLVAALVAAETPRLRELPRRAWPLLIALPLPLAWWLGSLRADAAHRTTTRLQLGLFRLGDLPVLLTGIPWRWVALTATGAVLLSLAATFPAPSRTRSRWVPFALATAIVLLAPNILLGTAYLAPRFTVFLLPTLLCALDRPHGAPVARWRRLQTAGVAGLLLLVAQARFAGMEREGRGLAELLREAPAGRRLLYFGYEFRSRYSPEPVFLHSGARYQVERCGVADKSFAGNFPSPVRYRPGAALPLPPLVEYLPHRFRWDEHGGDRVDLVLVRSRREPNVRRIGGAPGRLALLAHRERWWLYENVERRPTERASSP